MNWLSRLLAVVFQDRWMSWGMIGVAILLGAMLLVPAGSLADRILNWSAAILLAFALSRGVYVGWCFCRGKRPIAERAEAVRRRERIENYVFAAVFGLMLVLALCRLIP